MPPGHERLEQLSIIYFIKWKKCYSQIIHNIDMIYSYLITKIVIVRFSLRQILRLWHVLQPHSINDPIVAICPSLYTVWSNPLTVQVLNEPIPTPHPHLFIYVALLYIFPFFLIKYHLLLVCSQNKGLCTVRTNTNTCNS